VRKWKSFGLQLFEINFSAFTLFLFDFRPMRTISVLFFSLLMVAFCTTVATAQTTPIKIVIIDSNAFSDGKTGITKYINVFNQLDAEFKARRTELENLAVRLQNLQKEVQPLQEAYQKNPKGPIGAAQIQPKLDEIERIKREGSFKQEEFNTLVARRRQQLLAPVVKDISLGLQEFAKLKGYSLIFDLAKDEAGFLVVLGDQKLEVTKDFIAFYNARPATSAIPK
jgi:Skp family chaperone for outer membrane proteins